MSSMGIAIVVAGACLWVVGAIFALRRQMTVALWLWGLALVVSLMIAYAVAIGAVHRAQWRRMGLEPGPATAPAGSERD